MEEYSFTLDYNCNLAVDKSLFLSEEAHLPFDSKSKPQMKLMMQEIARGLDITEEYALRKLEVVLRYELPFFAVNRRLVKNWLMDNFIF